jgi:xylose isomerase
VVEGKTMKEHLRFSVVYWHTFRGTGSRSVRPGHTMSAPGTTAATRSRTPEPRARRLRVHREARRAVLLLPRPRRGPEGGKTLAETNKNLDAVVKVLKEEQQRTGIKLLWGTANLFSNPRYMHGAPPAATPTSSPTPPPR